MNFLKVIADWVVYVFPFLEVREYQRGVWYRFGRYRKTLGPGIYWRTPFISKIKVFDIMRRTVTTPVQSITVSDGGTLTFSASAQLHVTDAAKAMNDVQDFMETATEDIAAILSEFLATADSSTLDPEKRRLLVRQALRLTTKHCEDYGVEVVSLRFNNFLRNIRVYRLFNDSIQATPGMWLKEGE